MKNINKDKIKMIVTDLDNTYLNKNVMSEYGESIIKKLIEKGYRVVFATGRNKRLANNALNDENIYYVVMNGAAIYKGNNPIDKSSVFKKEQLNYLINCLDQYNTYVNFVSDFSNICCLDKEFYMETIFAHNVLKFSEEEARAMIPTKFEKDVNTIKEDIYKVEVSFNNYNSYLKACKELSNIKEINVYGNDKDYIEINKSDTSKAHGCVKLCNKLNINLDEVIVFGDSKNDLEILNLFPYSICVCDANEEVKRVCCDICDTSKNDGVAHYLENLFLK